MPPDLLLFACPVVFVFELLVVPWLIFSLTMLRLGMYMTLLLVLVSWFAAAAVIIVGKLSLLRKIGSRLGLPFVVMAERVPWREPLVLVASPRFSRASDVLDLRS